MRRELSMSFVRGARVGAYVTLPALAAVMLLVAAIVAGPGVAGPGAAGPEAQAAASLMPSRIDRALTLAVAPEAAGAARQMFFTLSRDEGPSFEGIEVARDAVDDPPVEPPPEPTSAATATPPPASPTTAPTPAVTTRPALVLPSGQLAEILTSYFPEDPDYAYGVVMCESSGNATINTGNGYYGLWQFDLPTWQSVGGTGLPSDASVEEQMRRARMLYESRGWQPWGCAR